MWSIQPSPGKVAGSQLLSTAMVDKSASSVHLSFARGGMFIQCLGDTLSLSVHLHPVSRHSARPSDPPSSMCCSTQAAPAREPRSYASAPCMWSIASRTGWSACSSWQVRARPCSSPTECWRWPALPGGSRRGGTGSLPPLPRKSMTAALRSLAAASWRASAVWPAASLHGIRQWREEPVQVAGSGSWQRVWCKGQHERKAPGETKTPQIALRTEFLACPSQAALKCDIQ
jgi:hypothetical protein